VPGPGKGTETVAVSIPTRHDFAGKGPERVCFLKKKTLLIAPDLFEDPFPVHLCLDMGWMHPENLIKF
jgi:hypothetical protein